MGIGKLIDVLASISLLLIINEGKEKFMRISKLFDILASITVITISLLLISVGIAGIVFLINFIRSMI